MVHSARGDSYNAAMDKAICVFCASSSAVAPTYFRAANELGTKLAERGDTLVYGGGNIGLMGELAVACHRGGGRVVGVIPDSLKDKELAYEQADELIVTQDMRDRKTHMERRSDAFIALPGGFGTLEELLEIITLRQLNYHDKPIVVVNLDGFYDRLFELFEQFIESRFAKSKHRRNFAAAADVDSALGMIDQYLLPASSETHRSE